MGIKRYIPDAITLGNLASGLLGVVAALAGEIDKAFVLMLAGAVFDFFDGMAARLLHAGSDLGKQLDSLSDLVTFGVLPSIMLYESMVLQGSGPWAFGALSMALFAAVRLAKFDVDTRQSLDFIGLPSPSAAILAGSLTSYVISGNPGSVFSVWVSSHPLFWLGVALLLGILMVCEIPMFGIKVAKGRKLMDAKRWALVCVCFLAIAITAATGQNWTLVPVVIILGYITENLILKLLPE